MAKEWMEYSDISVTAKIYTHMVDEVFEQNRKRLADYANKKEELSQIAQKRKDGEETSPSFLNAYRN